MTLGKSGEHEVADGVTGQGPVAAEPVLEQVCPGGRPGVRAGQRGQRHSQVTHGQRSQLGPQATRRAPVVTHSHNRGEMTGDAPQRPQGCGQTVTPAEGHHRGIGNRHVIDGSHSRPRSR